MSVLDEVAVARSFADAANATATALTSLAEALHRLERLSLEGGRGAANGRRHRDILIKGEGGLWTSEPAPQAGALLYPEPESSS